MGKNDFVEAELRSSPLVSPTTKGSDTYHARAIATHARNVGTGTYQPGTHEFA